MVIVLSMVVKNGFVLSMVVVNGSPISSLSPTMAINDEHWKLKTIWSYISSNKKSTTSDQSIKFNINKFYSWTIIWFYFILSMFYKMVQHHMELSHNLDHHLIYVVLSMIYKMIQHHMKL